MVHALQAVSFTLWFLVEGHNRKGEEKIDRSEYQALGTDCVFGALQGVTFLAQAGAAIDRSALQCGTNDVMEEIGLYSAVEAEKEKAECAADISNVVHSFSYATAFLSACVDHCEEFVGKERNLQAECAADVASIISATAALAMAGSEIYPGCDPDGVGGPDVRKEPYELSPPPQGVPPLEQTPEQRMFASEVAFCVIYSLQATWWLARAGINIDAATENCNPTNTKSCAVSVMGVLQAFGDVAAYISYTASQCSHNVNTPGAICASAVSDIAASLLDIAAAATAASTSCTGKLAQEPEGEFMFERRLSALNSKSGTVAPSFNFSHMMRGQRVLATSSVLV